MDWAPVGVLAQGNAWPSPEDVFRGVLKSYSSKDGYGFISCPALHQAFGRDIYIDQLRVPAKAQRGCVLEFSIRISNRGQPQVMHASLVGPGVPIPAGMAELGPHDLSDLGDPVDTLDLELLRVAKKTGPYGISVEKRGKKSKLGIDVDTTHTGGLMVDAVSGGLVEEWNQMNPHRQVKPGDCLMEVNGVVGDAGDMLQECRVSQRLNLVFSRGEKTVVDGVLPSVYVVSWNVLAGAAANRQNFPDVDFGVFNEGRRRAQTAAALAQVAADVFCLQGVDCPLEELGLGANSEYDCCTVQHSAGRFDRCVVAWRRAKLEMGPGGHRVLFFDDHPPPMAIAAECNPSYFNTGIAGLAVELRVRSDPGRRCFTVATTQLSWEPAKSDAYAWQMHKFLSVVFQFAGPRILLCGDLNSLPGAQPYQFLSQGCGLESVYRDSEGADVTCSRSNSGQGGFAAMTDYVWYAPKWFRVQKRIELLTVEDLQARRADEHTHISMDPFVPSLLSASWPSDHLLVGAFFELTNPEVMDEWGD